MTETRASRRSDVLKNARVAVHMIGADVLNAGLGYNRTGAVVPDNFNSTQFGARRMSMAGRDMLTSIVVGNNIYQNNLSANTTPRTDMIAFAYRDMILMAELAVKRLLGVGPQRPGTRPCSRLSSKATTRGSVPRLSLTIFSWSNRAPHRLP